MQRPDAMKSEHNIAKLGGYSLSATIRSIPYFPMIVKDFSSYLRDFCMIFRHLAVTNTAMVYILCKISKALGRRCSKPIKSEEHFLQEKVFLHVHS